MIELTGVYFDGRIGKWVVGESVAAYNSSDEIKFHEEFAEKHNMSYADTRISISKEDAYKAAEEENKELADGYTKVIRCKDCKRFWVLDKDTVNWYERRSLSTPKRCIECREKKKIATNNERFDKI